MHQSISGDSPHRNASQRIVQYHQQPLVGASMDDIHDMPPRDRHAGSIERFENVVVTGL
jgi:hypothetical protein